MAIQLHPLAQACSPSDLPFKVIPLLIFMLDQITSGVIFGAKDCLGSAWEMKTGSREYPTRVSAVTT